MDLSAQNCKLNMDLQVAEPTVAPGLDTRRIAVYEGKQELNFYTNARWTAPAAEMLQNSLVEGFENSKIFRNVSTDMDGAASDVILFTDIRAFQVEGGEVSIRFVSKLINTETREIITTIETEKTEVPAAHSIENIAEAFSNSTNDSIKELIEKFAAAYPKCKK